MRIRGQVLDESGRAVPQATVLITGRDTEVQRESTADAEGFYEVDQLPEGTYRLEARAEGHLPQVHDAVRLGPSVPLQLNFRLRQERRTLREVEERGAQERNPNIFIRRVDLNALRDPLLRRGIEPVFLRFEAVENTYGADMGAPIRQILFVRPQPVPTRFHGSLHETHENSALNTRPFFNVGPLRPSKRNQFGLRAGGPIQDQQLSFSTQLEFVSESGFVNGNVRVPKSSERVPTAQDPETRAVVAALLQAYPEEEPNLPGVAPRQLNTNAIRRIDSFDWSFRLDYPARASDRLAFQYTLFDYSEEPFELVIGENPQTDLRPQTFAASHSREWSAATQMRSAFQFDRLVARLEPTERFRSLLVPLSLDEVPDISFGGDFADLSRIGPGVRFPRQRFQNRFSGNLDLSHQQGNHQLRFGGRLTRVQLNDLQSDDGRGNFIFSDNFGRSTVENLLEGTPTKFTITLGDLYRGFRNWEQALYIQDTYRVRPGFHLNLGLRYELITVPEEVNGLTRFDYRTDADKFGPRLGIAWTPAASTVVRAGYGIAFAHIFPGTYQRARFNPPAVTPLGLQNTSLVNPLEGITLEAGAVERPELNLLSPDLVSPYSHQYNLLIQRRLSPNFLFQVGYAGNRTYKPFYLFITNRAEPVPGIPATTATVDQRRADPNFLRILTVINTGAFYYDGLKVNLTRTLSGGLSFNLDYLFSKSLASSGEFAATMNGEAGFLLNQSNDDLHADLKSPSNFDHRHIFSVHYAYLFPSPFGAGALATVFNGWEISGVTEYRTGSWYGIKTSSDAPGFGNVDGQGGDRVNITNPGILGRAVDDPDTSTTLLRPEFFNTDIPAGGRGNSPFHAFRADAINNTNLSLRKTFAFARQEQSVEFGAEFLNLFNHPLFDRAADVFPSDVFGKIVDTQNKGRVIRFLLRLNF